MSASWRASVKLAKLKLVTACAKMRVVDDASLSAVRRPGTVLSMSLVVISSSTEALTLFTAAFLNLSTTINLESLRAVSRFEFFSVFSVCGEFLPTIRLTTENRNCSIRTLSKNDPFEFDTPNIKTSGLQKC
jgi:hypothetical protein